MKYAAHPNIIQAKAIGRYHARLARHGKTVSIDTAAMEWISKYARLFREKYNAGRLPATLAA